MLPSSHAPARTSHTVWHRAALPLRLLNRFRAARALRHQHRALALLNDALLRDIGVTRAQVEVELARPVWDAPTHWRD